MKICGITVVVFTTEFDMMIMKREVYEAEDETYDAHIIIFVM